MRLATVALSVMLVLAAPSAPRASAAPVQDRSAAEQEDPFPLTSGRFGTLGAPSGKGHRDVLGASWFQSGDWVRDGRAQAWLLIRPRTYFTGSNRVTPPSQATPPSHAESDALSAISYQFGWPAQHDRPGRSDIPTYL